MLILNNTTDTLQVTLGGAVNTNQLDCVASYREITTTTFDPKTASATTNDTTPITLVSAPNASTQHIIDEISVFNKDVNNATVTARLNRNGTILTLFRTVLSPNEKLQYTDKNGWGVYTTAGALKQSINQGINATGSGIQTVVLGSDVVNNNAVANTMQDVTGLAFPVVAGKNYNFRFYCIYDAQATTTGSRWSVNGASGATFSNLRYRSEYSLTTTTITTNAFLQAVDLPAACNATSAVTAGNVAIVEGSCTADTDGSMILRFASEVLNSAITAKANQSFVRFQEIS